MGKTKPIVTKAWGIAHGKYITPFYVQSTRKEAINSLLRNTFNRYSWRHFQKSGYRCVKVEIREVKS